MHSFHFDDQYNTFHSYGYAVAPGGQAVVGDEEALAEKKGAPSFPGSKKYPVPLKPGPSRSWYSNMHLRGF